jgi:hypothetical protein
MHITNDFAPTTSEEIKSLESSLGCTLPSEYRSFLEQSNGGNPGAIACFRFCSGSRSSLLSYFYGIQESPYWASIYYAIRTFSDELPKEALPIASDAGGNQIVLFHSGSEKGSVYFWDHEEGIYTDYRLADSFDLFISSLYEDIPEDESDYDRIVRTNAVDELKTLISNGADLEFTDEYDRTVIEIATIHNREDMIRILFDAGADLRNSLDIARNNLEFFPEFKTTIELLEKLQEIGSD